MKLLIILHLVIVCQGQNTNLWHLNIKLNRLTRITGGLQKDVSDILTVISTSGLVNLDFGNKTRTINNNNKGSDECNIAEINGTMDNVKALTSDVEELIVSSRNGFKNEKEFQREVIRDLKKSNTDFQTKLADENANVKHNVEELNTKVTDLEETSKYMSNIIQGTSKNLTDMIQETDKNNHHKIENLALNLNDNIDKTDAQSVIIESMKETLDTITEKQSKLEEETKKLKQETKELRQDNEDLRKENKELGQETTESRQENEVLRQETKGLRQETTELRQENEALRQETKELRQETTELRQENEVLRQETKELKQKISGLEGELTILQSTTFCEKNWTMFNSHCYLFMSDKLSWDDALATCRSTNSYLIEINSDTESMFFAEPDNWSFPIHTWVGATNVQEGFKGTFVYDDSKLAVPENFWNDGEPNNKGGHENCVHMFKKGRQLKLNDRPCAHLLNFICEKPGTLVAQ